MKKPEKPDESELLAYLDEELPAERHAEIRQMLAGSWELRAQLARVEKRIEQYIEATAFLAPAEPPSADDLWRDFSRRYGQLNPSANGSQFPHLPFSFLAQMARWCQTRWQPAFRVRLAVGAVFSLFLVLTFSIFWWRIEQPVSAHELLQRSRLAEARGLNRVGEPVVYRKIQIKRQGTNETLQWESWNDARRNQFRQRVADQRGVHFLRTDDKTVPTLLSELTTVFRANHFDLQCPLSAAAFAEWRAQARAQAEAVTASPSILKLTVLTAEPYPPNALIEASLLVRKSDWHPVTLQLSVQGETEIRRYELSETAYEILPLQALTVFTDLALLPSLAPTVPPLLSATASPTPTIAVTPTTRPLPTEAELREAEVATLYALHQAQADRGEQIEVVRDDHHQIVVQGLVETEARKEQLAKALATIPLVNMRLQSVEAALQQAAQPPLPPTVSSDSLIISEAAHTNDVPGKSAFEQRLTQYFKAQGETPKNAERKFAELSNAVVAHSAAALSDAWALRRLAERFPADREKELNEAARQRIEEMLRQHLSRLQQHASALRGQLEPVLVAIAGTNVTPSARGAEAPWQTQGLAVFKAVERVHQLAGKAFTANDATAADQTAQQMLDALATMSGAAQSLTLRINK